MNWSKIGRWVLLAGSVVLGILAGLGGLWIFEAKVPAAMQTTMLAAEARVYYLGAGALFGGAIFAWSLAAVWITARSAGAKSRHDSKAK